MIKGYRISSGGLPYKGDWDACNLTLGCKFWIFGLAKLSRVFRAKCLVKV